MYFIADKADGLIEENHGKIFNLTTTDNNKEALTKYIELWNRIKNLTKAINGTPVYYNENYMKIKSSSDDILLLNKLLKLHNLTIAIRYVFQEGNKCYPQVFLDEYLYEL